MEGFITERALSEHLACAVSGYERALAQGENNYHEAAEHKYEIYVNITRGLNSPVSVSPSVS